MKALSLIALATGLLVEAQQPRNFPQPDPAKPVTITEIPGIIAAGSQWKMAWQGTATADGMAGTKDGGILFAQEQTNTVFKLDKDDKVSAFLTNPHGPGAVAFGPKEQIYTVERTCTDPGGKPDECKEATAVSVLNPTRKVLADSMNGKGLGRVNDLVADRKGNIYFTSGGLFHLNVQGQTKVTEIGSNLRTNGVMLSPDEKTLYVTNGTVIAAFDLQPDGSATNQREFGKLEGGGNGDGMIIDSKGNLYVTTNPGIQVLNPQGKYLGVIPTPRAPITVTFSGPNKKLLYAGMMGSIGPDGQEVRTGPGVRNVAMTVYKIPMLSQGFGGRAK
jgi:sugar lactone lactonase YvrE